MHKQLRRETQNSPSVLPRRHRQAHSIYISVGGNHVGLSPLRPSQVSTLDKQQLCKSSAVSFASFALAQSLFSLNIHSFAHTPSHLSSRLQLLVTTQSRRPNPFLSHTSSPSYHGTSPSPLPRLHPNPSASPPPKPKYGVNATTPPATLPLPPAS